MPDVQETATIVGVSSMADSYGGVGVACMAITPGGVAHLCVRHPWHR